MLTQYVFKGEVIGSLNQSDNLPTHLRIPTRHTLKDLLAIELRPSSYQVVVTADTFVPRELDWDKKMKAAYWMYNELANVKNPSFDRWTDTLRWHIKKALLKLKVIN